MNDTKIRRLDFPTAIVHGGGCPQRLPALARELAATRVLLVTDAGMVKLGVAGEVCGLLETAGLPVAWAQPGHREARAGMMLAATLGGMAFSNSSVCLVHGMSRPIGALFHVPHGLSNAVLLPTVARYSIEPAPDRYAAVARAAGCAPESFVDWLEQLNQSLRLPRLSQCRGVTRDRFDAAVAKMADDALASGSPANNPRVPSADEIVALYRQAW